ncbi:MAG: S1 RNA-binding domain-containing protein [Clostridia bacterium]|nr:S1 RNA-binding domain-containing protein [Clostridia bacterium]
MQLEVGAILEGKVTGVTKFGAFVELPDKKTGMVHISEVAPTFVKEIRDFVTEGQAVKVKVLSISEEGKISLSMKKAMPPAPRQAAPRRAVSAGRPGDFEWQSSASRGDESFEDMMSRFKATSDEKISDLKRSLDGKHGGFGRRPRGNGGPQGPQE